MISEGEGHVPLEKVVEDSPYLELGDYCVIGRRADSWEAIATVLTALDERHSNSLQPMLERLWRVTSDYVYGQGGLCEVLTSEEMLQADAAADREDRRARSGFVAASSARSFLSLARAGDVASLLQAPSRDPVTGAFFRDIRGGAARGRRGGQHGVEPAPEAAGLRELLDEAAGDAPAPRLLGSGQDGQPAGQTLLARALVELAARDADRHAERIRELGYLANVLLAGVGSRGERLRPVDAAQAALATCSLGLERALAEPRRRGARGTRRRTSAAKRLERLSCDLLFRVGWRLLHDEVSCPAAAAVERVATRLASAADAPRARAPLEQLALAARTALKEGRPASLAGRLDVLAGALDDGQLARLAALSEELPALLSADGAPPERIASAAHLRRARTFLEAL